MQAAAYTPSQSILIVGDGDFSFAHALASKLGTGRDITATSFDTAEEVTEKYAAKVQRI